MKNLTDWALNMFAGSYGLEIFAALSDQKDSSHSSVFTYVINVPEGNPEFVPFPTVSDAWRENRCELDEVDGGLVDGHVEAGQNKVIKVVAPGAQNVMVECVGNTQAQLGKVRHNIGALVADGQ